MNVKQRRVARRKDERRYAAMWGEFPYVVPRGEIFAQPIAMRAQTAKLYGISIDEALLWRESHINANPTPLTFERMKEILNKQSS